MQRAQNLYGVGGAACGVAPLLSDTDLTAGTNEDASYRVRHMEMEATCAGLDHQQLLYEACSHLISAAASWLDTLTLSTWAEFRTAVVSRFGELVASKLCSCMQNKNEDVASYAYRCQRLTAKLNAASSALPSCILPSLHTSGSGAASSSGGRPGRSLHINATWSRLLVIVDLLGCNPFRLAAKQSLQFSGAQPLLQLVEVILAIDHR